MKKFALLLSIVLFLHSLPSAADAVQQKPPDVPRIIWLDGPGQEDEGPPQVAHITIIKSKRKMYLLDKHGNVLKEYTVSLGGDPVGDKRQEGDKKTPEGKYKIDFKNENSEYHKSLRISYPNPSDLSRAKKLGVNPGGNIYIHGAPNDRGWMFWKYNTKRDWTFGCIALNNGDIDEVWKMVPTGTTVLIKP